MYSHRYAVAGALVLAVVTLGAVGAVAQSAGPAAPVNLEVIRATEDTIEIAWGPSQPGPFSVLSESRNSVVVAWEPSKDTRSAIAYYNVWRDGVLQGTMGSNVYTVTGLNKRKNQFRICVQAVSQTDLKSAQGCATFTRS